MKKKVELLAPAGNYEAFLGAVNAGADAIYLGGEKFGARAYADNFTTEEICRAIHVAHFMGRKIYLTVNTLLKEEEFEELVPYLSPFYEAGLDGIIVQDIGVLRRVREAFPGLALHASTQMTLTGPEGCAFLKEQGVERVVPARELSLQEICKIKERTGLEIECFIHGAMCYCYSGQCLFSSMLGGRSGNRGRCAQPCRLPYRVLDGGKAASDVEYPLSLKDMCTISYLPELIEAGIDSFKIEGRMKKAEYAAGVTALYRKYIDLYYGKGRDNYKVERRDLEKLKALYIRSEIQTGYYERHNGREMITLHKPSYSGSDEQLLEQIRTAYLKEPDKVSVNMKVCLQPEEPVRLQITGQGTSVSVSGPVAETAQKAPLQKEDVQKRFKKTGNSCVSVSACEVIMPKDVFLSVKALNELRREGVAAFEEEYIRDQGMITGRNSIESKPTESVSNTDAVIMEPSDCDTDIRVSSYEQLDVAIHYECRRIYIESDLYLKEHQYAVEVMTDCPEHEYYLALPYILRERDLSYMEQLNRLLEDDSSISGFLVRNFESAAWVHSRKSSYKIVPDAGLYCFNAESVHFWAQYSKEYTLPYELNQKEAGELVRRTRDTGCAASMIVYGRTPMMITANCVRKTAGGCKGAGKDGRQMSLKDRYGVVFPVEINCTHCYNIIYNSVPCSLHRQRNMVKRIGADVYRYDFTVETADECRRILTGNEFPFESCTTGHLKRGVE